MLVSSASGLTFWGMIATLGPLAAAGSLIGVLPHSLKVLILLIGPVFVPFGNFTMGLLADRFGRKKIFLFTMILYGTGIIVISLSYAFVPLLFGLMLAEFGVGGEEIPSLSLISEDSPISQRAKWLTIISDFDNIGSAVTAGLFAVIVNSFIDRIVLIISASILIIIMAISRIKLPESFKWQEAHGKLNEAQKTKSELYIDSQGNNVKMPPYRLTLFVLMVMAISQYTTFGLMAYVIGPYEFPGTFTDDMIIFVALVGASIAGFIAAPLISRGRKTYTVYSYLIGFLTTVAIFLLVPELHDVFIFYPLLLVNMLLWLLGVAGALIWYHYGIETKEVNIDYNKVPRNQ